MKKDLVLITAFCNTEHKTSTLRKLVNSLKESEKFDIFISSHSPLPTDLVDSTDYFFYDSKNILLKDFDLRSAAWFYNGDGNNPINSIFVGFSNTHLAVWRLIILGNKIAKSLGYNKVHHIEYDTKIDHTSEIEENSKLLENYDVVTYTIDDPNHRGLLLGSFQSYRLDTISNTLIDYNEEEIIDMIRQSNVKSPEMFLKNILHTNKKFLEKPIKDFKLNGIKFAFSKIKSEHPAWCLPFYDRKMNTLNFIVWNSDNFENLNVKLIYNNKNVYTIPNVNQNEWRTLDLGNYDESEELIVMVNNKIRDVYDFKNIRESFKLYSYR